MRIGISTSVIQRGRTGIAQYLFALLRAMQPQAAKHHFVLFVLRQDLPLFDFAKDCMELVPVPERMRPPANNVFWHQIALPRLARRHRLDVLHVPSYRRLLWPKPCALAGTIHDLAPFRVPNKYDWKRMFYGRVIARQLARRQDALIAVSHSTARDIISFFRLAPERITVIPNGVDHTRFFPAGNALDGGEATGAHSLRRPFFLYVARLEHPGKNHLRLVAAFEKFKASTGSDWQLVLGGSDWHGAEVIHARIAQSPFAADIRCLGFVRDAELPDWYRAAGVFVYPSLYEGFGMPPLEAMACGCPVISSTRGSLGEVVGDAGALVDPEDTDSIAGHLSFLATDSAARARLRCAGLARARKFDWTRAALETMEVYRRAVASRVGQPQPAAAQSGCEDAL
jgi:glycosyltransferase involved in cell wall biosynthesis